jgi:hypothetical protein
MSQRILFTINFVLHPPFPLRLSSLAKGAGSILRNMNTVAVLTGHQLSHRVGKHSLQDH